MEVEITEERDNPVLHRKEVSFRVSHKGATPKREEVRKKLTGKLSADKEAFVLKRLVTSFGSGESKGIVHLYESREHMLGTEPRHVLRRNFTKDELAGMGIKLKKEA